MSRDDNREGGGNPFLNWLRDLFSGNGFFGQLFSFFESSDAKETAEPSFHAPKPSISYSDVENANTSLEIKATPLEKARKALQDVEDGQFNYSVGKVTSSSAYSFVSSRLEQGPDVVHEWLERAGVNASALDPAGKKSAAEMEATIRDAPRLGHISRARKYFAEINSPAGDPGGMIGDYPSLSEDPAEIVRRMMAELDQANQDARGSSQKPVDLSALDPTGTKSSTKMEEELHRRIVEGYILAARKEFYLLSNLEGESVRLNNDNTVQEWLNKANKAAKEYGFAPIETSALDVTGTKSASEMDKELLKAIENKHVAKASQILYWSKTGGFGNPADGAAYLKEELAAANATASALGEQQINVSTLDPSGGKLRAQDDREKAELARAHNREQEMQMDLARLKRAHTMAETFAIQDGPALARFIHPLDTPPVDAAITPDRRK